jgi:hypothetical protein
LKRQHTLFINNNDINPVEGNENWLKYRGQKGELTTIKKTKWRFSSHLKNIKKIKLI